MPSRGRWGLPGAYVKNKLAAARLKDLHDVEVLRKIAAQSKKRSGK